MCIFFSSKNKRFVRILTQSVQFTYLTRIKLLSDEDSIFVLPLVAAISTIGPLKYSYLSNEFEKVELCRSIRDLISVAVHPMLVNVNGSQLVKTTKSIPHMSLS